MISNWSQIESDCMKRLRSFVVYISFSFSWTEVYQEKAKLHLGPVCKWLW